MKSDLRKNQLVIPFGVGATYNYLLFSAITMSVDEWNIQYEKKLALSEGLMDHRLISYINKKLRSYEGSRSLRIRFLCSPPIDYDPFASQEEQAVTGPYTSRKFPQWGSCSRCSALVKFNPTHAYSTRCQNPNSPPWMKSQQSCLSLKGNAGKIEPVRFVAYCSKGHIQDLPYIKIMQTACSRDCDLNNKQHSPTAPYLYLSDDTLGFGFTSISINCASCGSRKRFRGIGNEEDRDKFISSYGEKIFQCEGAKPWTSDVNDECSEMLSVSPRAASKLYLPVQESALKIPDADLVRNPFLDTDEVIKWIEKGTDLIKIRDMIEALDLDEKHSMNKEDMLKLIQEERDSAENHDIELDENIDLDKLEDSFYKKEFETLIKENVNERDFVSKKEDLFQYSKQIQKSFESLHSVKKLIEITANLGFERKGRANIEFNESFQPARVNENFLPAFKSTGEGIFINFGLKNLEDWYTSNSNFKNLEEQLSINASSSQNKNIKAKNYDYRFILIHTFSHLLMRQLEIECGYSLTEIKERIYFSEAENMAGLLIYTASADSQGSLGGLVRMIKPSFFEGVFKNAIENAYVCFNDPICIESKGQGYSGLSLGACHACAMIPDLACSTLPKNIFLDRNALIGNETNAKGYFSNF